MFGRFITQDVIRDVGRYLEQEWKDSEIQVLQSPIPTPELEQSYGSSPRQSFDALYDEMDEASSEYDELSNYLEDTSHNKREAQKARIKDSLHFERHSETVKESDDLDDTLKRLGQTFQEMLLHLIDEKGFTDTEVYSRANLNRKLFSKIRCNKNYKPSKSTAFALAIALKLNLDEATDLLSRAGIAFSPSSKSDLIVKYCILHEIFDIFSVNEILYEYDQQLIGS